MACFLLWSSAVRVHDSQAYRKIDVTRERISRILELREILLSIQTCFSLANAAVACAILESISGLDTVMGHRPVSSRLITIRLRAIPFNITVQAYAPTSDHDDNEAEEFYDQLQNIINETPKRDILVGQQISQNSKLCSPSCSPRTSTCSHHSNTQTSSLVACQSLNFL